MRGRVCVFLAGCRWDLRSVLVVGGRLSGWVARVGERGRLVAAGVVVALVGLVVFVGSSLGAWWALTSLPEAPSDDPELVADPVDRVDVVWPALLLGWVAMTRVLKRVAWGGGGG